MDLILKISKEEKGLITDMDQHLFAERSRRGGYAFFGDFILKTDPILQRAGEKSNAVFLNMSSVYPSAMSHFNWPYWNYKWLDNRCAPNFPFISTFEENSDDFKIDCKIPM